MSIWLTVAIWIIFMLWSFIEVSSLYILIKTYPKMYYTRTAIKVTYLWILFTIFWLSYQFIG